MKNVDELKFPTFQKVLKSPTVNREHERMWITLCFRMAMKLLQTGLINLHDHGNSTTEKLLKECKGAAELPDTTNQV